MSTTRMTRILAGVTTSLAAGVFVVGTFVLPANAAPNEDPIGPDAPALIIEEAPQGSTSDEMPAEQPAEQAQVPVEQSAEEPANTGTDGAEDQGEESGDDADSQPDADGTEPTGNGEEPTEGTEDALSPEEPSAMRFDFNTAVACVKTASFTHTYFGAMNGGVITATGEFCGETLYVTPTEWAFTANANWPQSRVDYYDIAISAPGDYPYGNAVACGQGDIYAQWGSPLVPTPTLSNPSVEFPEHFLHQESTGPTTYVIQANTCWTPPPPCVSAPVYSYTFDPATGSGEITVTGGTPGEALCTPLYVRAAAWTYDVPVTPGPGPSWPQTLYGTPGDTTVDTIGVFSYGPPQLGSCRQYDAYASFNGFGDLALPTHLIESHNPSEPSFLHETLNGFGPNPTYSFTTGDGCNPGGSGDAGCEVNAPGAFLYMVAENHYVLAQDYLVTVDGVTTVETIQAGDTIPFANSFAEDSGDHSGSLSANGVILYDSGVFSSNCQAEGDFNAVTTDDCGWIQHNVTYTAVINKGQAPPDPITWYWMDENGVLQSHVLNANDPPFTVRVDYGEDSNGGSVTAKYGTNPDDLASKVIGTNCKPPTTIEKLAVTAQEMGGVAGITYTILSIIALIMVGIALAVAGYRRRKTGEQSA